LKKAELAQQLRQRQYAYEMVTRDLIDAVTDDQIINSYITCSCCGTKEVDEKELVLAIAEATSAVDFFRLCKEKAAKWQQPDTDQGNCCEGEA